MKPALILLLVLSVVLSGCATNYPPGTRIDFPPDATLADVHRWMRRHSNLKVGILDPDDLEDHWSIEIYE